MVWCVYARAAAASTVGWDCRGGGCCRRGSVRMISEGVSTRICASASRSPPAVTVTLGARTGAAGGGGVACGAAGGGAGAGVAAAAAAGAGAALSSPLELYAPTSTYVTILPCPM